MPTPTFALRLSKESQSNLARMAKVYGSSSTRSFAREMLEVMCSGSEQDVQKFLLRLFERMTGQMTLDLAAAAKTHAERSTRTTRGARKARKQRRTHERTT